jgi:hypothetical protein
MLPTQRWLENHVNHFSKPISCVSLNSKTIKITPAYLPNFFLHAMNVKEEIKSYIGSQPELKKSDMQKLHSTILKLMPGCKLWFMNGMNADNKIVSNPNIGYGSYMLNYANGTTKEFYQIGLSANTTGISVYILGIKDKKYLAEAYGKAMGKASVSGYCIKFKTLKDINLDTLQEAIQFGVASTR